LLNLKPGTRRETAMKDCKAKAAGKMPALKIAHCNDRAAVRHWLAGNG
jgi:hypothetical protein